MRTIYITEEEWALLRQHRDFHYHQNEKTLRQIISETLKCGPVYGPFKFEKQTAVDAKKRAKFLQRSVPARARTGAEGDDDKQRLRHAQAEN